jgi:hypothetical protein
VPLPAGWKAVGAKEGDDEVPLAIDGAIDLSARQGRVNVRVRVERAKG